MNLLVVSQNKRDFNKLIVMPFSIITRGVIVRGKRDFLPRAPMGGEEARKAWDEKFCLNFLVINLVTEDTKWFIPHLQRIPQNSKKA